jgi:serine/threonine protein kinase
MHLRNAPPPLSGVPPRIAQLVMRCLDKDPKRRPGSAAELESLCQKLLIETSGGMPVARHVSGPSPVVESPAAYPPRTQALPSGGLPPSPHQGLSPQGGHPGGTMVLPEGGLLPSDAGRLPASAPQGWSAEGSSSGRRAAHADFYDGETQGTKLPDARPAGALFWIAWVLLGLGGGLAAHFWMRAAG